MGRVDLLLVPRVYRFPPCLPAFPYKNFCGLDRKYLRPLLAATGTTMWRPQGLLIGCKELVRYCNKMAHLLAPRSQGWADPKLVTSSCTAASLDVALRQTSIVGAKRDKIASHSCCILRSIYSEHTRVAAHKASSSSSRLSTLMSGELISRVMIFVNCGVKASRAPWWLQTKSRRGRISVTNRCFVIDKLTFGTNFYFYSDEHSVPFLNFKFLFRLKLIFRRKLWKTWKLLEKRVFCKLHLILGKFQTFILLAVGIHRITVSYQRN